MAVVVNADECTACGICAGECPSEALTVEDVAKVDADACTECGICVGECPSEALSL